MEALMIAEAELELDRMRLIEDEAGLNAKYESAFTNLAWDSPLSVDSTTCYTVPGKLDPFKPTLVPAELKSIHISKIHEVQGVAILARFYFQAGDLDASLQYLNMITFDTPPSEMKLHEQPELYPRLLMLQVVCMKIIVAYIRGLTEPETELNWLKQAMHGKFLNALFERNGWVSLVEDALYRTAFQTADEGNHWAAIGWCRDYLQCARYIPLEFFPWKRVSLLRFYIRLLTQNFRVFHYVPPKLFVDDSDDMLVPETLCEELSVLLGLYEHVLTSNASYPKAGRASVGIEQLYDDISLYYSMFSPMETSVQLFARQHIMTPVQPDPKEEQEEKQHVERPKTPAAVLKKLRRKRFPKAPLNPMHFNPPCSWAIFLDTMYRAAQFTFRSRALLARIGFIAALLESVDESIMAFKTYLEKDKKEKLADWQKGLPPSVSLDFSPIMSMSVINMSVTDDRRWWETSIDVICVLIAASKVSMDAFQFQQGISFSEKAVDMCKQNMSTCGKWVCPLSYYYLGVGYVLLGQETLEPEHFFNLQDQGHLMLREAQRLDPDHWRFWYSLALQAAEMGQDKIALESVKSSIKLNVSHIPSWHLMALLSTVRQPGMQNQTEFEMAAKGWRVCKLAQESVLAGKYVKKGQHMMPRDQLESFLNLKMTELLFAEIILSIPLQDNKSNVKDQRSTQEILQELRADVPVDIFDSYRQLFELYNRTYYKLKAYEVPPAPPPPKVEIFSAQTAMAEENPISMPMFHVLQDLNTNPYPHIVTNYPTCSPMADPYGVAFSGAYFPSGTDPIQPLHHSLYLRRKKMRYIELWIQLAQVFRRCGKFRDARMACVEAQKAERGNADIEFELGLIDLFEPSVKQSEKGLDLPFSLDEPSQNQRLPTNLFMVEIKDQPFPDAVSPTLAPLSPGMSSPTKTEFNIPTSKAAVASANLEDNINRAIVHFLSALTYDEEHTFSRTWLGRCYWLQGRYEMARAELERAAKGGRIRGHKVWHTCQQLALVYQSLNMNDKACEWFASSMKHQATSVPLTMLRGYEILPRYA